MNIISSQIWPSDMPDERRVIALFGLVQISEEGMDNAEIAKSCGATENQLSFDGAWNICMTEEALNSFASRLTAEKDAEIERLNALVSMQAEALRNLMVAVDNLDYSGGVGGIEQANNMSMAAEEALFATAETVSAWRDKRDEKVKRDFATWLCTQTCAQTAVLLYLTSKLRAKGE